MIDDMTNTPQADYDSPWKEIIEHYFPEFMAFFFPQAYAAIDWSAGYTFLDKELQQVIRQAETGSRRVDKLAQVTLASDNTEAWVLVHVEVQGQQEPSFEERMYIYNYRLFDRYRRRVASLAVLSDTNPNWHPQQYKHELFGCKVSLDFPTVKLLDYQDKWDELQANDNPFAVVVMAHLQTQATRNNPQERYAAKFKLAKLLYERGYQRQDIIDLYRFIDWVMALPTELEEQFMSDIVAYETRENKRYVTNIERIATRRGREQGLEQGLEQARKEIIMRILERKFGEAPEFIAQQLTPLSVPALDKLFDAALDAETLADFEQALVVVVQK